MWAYTDIQIQYLYWWYWVSGIWEEEVNNKSFPVHCPPPGNDEWPAMQLWPTPIIRYQINPRVSTTHLLTNNDREVQYACSALASTAARYMHVCRIAWNIILASMRIIRHATFVVVWNKTNFYHDKCPTCFLQMPYTEYTCISVLISYIQQT